MTNRRRFVQGMTLGLVAVGLVAGTALADELIGRITAVDVDAKTITVTEKGTDKETKIKVTDDTLIEKGKGGTQKVDLEKLQKGLEKAKRGFNVTVTHENGTASKIKFAPRKKAAPKGEGAAKD